jgi:hypothetical protein
VQVDLDLWIDGEHLSDSVQEARQRVDGFDWQCDDNSRWEFDLDLSRLGLGLDLEKGRLWQRWFGCLELVSPLVESRDGAAYRLTELGDGEGRIFKVSKSLVPELSFAINGLSHEWRS